MLFRLCLLVALLGPVGARAQTRVGVAAWPSRGSSRMLADAIDKTAQRFAAHFDAKVIPRTVRTRDVAIATRLKQASDQFAAGALDESARMFDAALEDATEAPYLFPDPSELITALVTRASIGLARQEPDRSRELLERALRYDPALRLSDEEASPTMSAMLSRARSKIGVRPATTSEELREACSDVEVVLSARAVTRETIELARFDKCQLIRSTTVALANLDSAIAELVGNPSIVPPRAPAGTATLSSTTATTATTARKRVPRWVPPIVAGFGVALLATGGALYGVSRSEYNDLVGSPCGMAGTCLPSSYAGARSEQEAGIGLLALGGAITVAGVIWWIVQR